MFKKFSNIFFQRSTWIGLLLICVALAGDYFCFLDEGTAIFLFIMGAGGFIPENSPVAHKILEIVARLLVRQIKLKAHENKKIPFELAPILWAFSLKSNMSNYFGRKIKIQIKDILFNQIRKREILMQEETATDGQVKSSGVTVSTIVEQVEQIISNALGDEESAKTKARIHMVGALFGTTIGVLLPLIDHAIDVDGLMRGFSQFNDGLLQEESGISLIKAALKKPLEDAGLKI